MSPLEALGFAPMAPDMERVEALLALCADRQPGYCVMGAYSHGRLRESLFGGVTRRLLTESRVPLILGH